MTLPPPMTTLTPGPVGSVLLTPSAHVPLPACASHCENAYAAALLSERPTTLILVPAGIGGCSFLSDHHAKGHSGQCPLLKWPVLAPHLEYKCMVRLARVLELLPSTCSTEIFHLGHECASTSFQSATKPVGQLKRDINVAAITI